MSYFWQNYFSNNFKLFDSVFKKGWWYNPSSTAIASKSIATLWLVAHILLFWWDKFFSNSIKSVSHYVSMKFFYWKPFIFLHISLFINLISPSLDLFKLCAALNLVIFCLASEFLFFLGFFGCCECWLPWIRLSCHYGK